MNQIVVKSTRPGSKIAASGLQQGDIITSCNGLRIYDFARINFVIDQAAAARQTSELRVLRDGKPVNISLSETIPENDIRLEVLQTASDTQAPDPVETPSTAKPKAPEQPQVQTPVKNWGSGNTAKSATSAAVQAKSGSSSKGTAPRASTTNTTSNSPQLNKAQQENKMSAIYGSIGGALGLNLVFALVFWYWQDMDSYWGSFFAGGIFFIPITYGLLYWMQLSSSRCPKCNKDWTDEHTHQRTLDTWQKWKMETETVNGKSRQVSVLYDYRKYMQYHRCNNQKCNNLWETIHTESSKA